MLPTISELQQEYPNPECSKESPNSYCVAGALMQALGENHKFPQPTFVMSALKRQGYKIHRPSSAYIRLNGCIWCNDNGEFQRAWAYLARFLTLLEEPSNDSQHQ